MRLSIALLIVAALIIIPPALLCAADTTTATAEGVAAVHNNPAAARDSAINDALRKAVEKAVGAVISAQTISENYTVLSDRVYSKTNGYIRSYDIISDDPGADLYRVQVKAEVAQAQIKDDLSALGLLLSIKNMPRVMVMVAEQNIGQEYFIYWWRHWGAAAGQDAKAGDANLTVVENVLLRELGKKGFNVVDPSVASGSISIPQAYRVVSLTNNAIKEIGTLFNADLVIYGKAAAKLKGSVLNSSMLSSTANISLRAVNTDDGRIIASDTASGAGVHPDRITSGVRALTQATETIADSLLDQITDRWSSDVSSGGLIQLSISGAVSYERLLAVKEALRENIRGVKNIYQRTFTAQNALLDVECTETAPALADAIARTDYTDFAVRITGVTQNKITLEITNN